MPTGPLWREGYRPFFLVFPLAGLGALGLWIWSLAGGPPARPVDHAALMIWGVLGSAVLGFLLTAYPRQNDATPPTARALAWALGAQLALLGAMLGSWLGLPLGGLATALGASIWGGATVWAARIAAPSLRRKRDATTAAVPFALLAGLVGWLLTRLGQDPRQGVALGLHPFLIGVALSLLDRLLPFFASKVVKGYDGVRKPFFTGPLLALLALRALGYGPLWLWDVGVLALLARQAAGWRAHRVLRAPMVAVLVLGVAWIAAGYAVDAALGQSPLATHLWTVGGLTTLVLGIATRVTRGHGGLPVALDGWGLAALLLVQAAALLRAALPAVIPLPSALQLHGSAALLGLALLLWWIRHAPLLRRVPGS